MWPRSSSNSIHSWQAGVGCTGGTIELQAVGGGSDSHPQGPEAPVIVQVSVTSNWQPHQQGVQERVGVHVRVQPRLRDFSCSLQVLRGLHIGATPSALLQVQGLGSVLEGAGAQRGDCTGCPAPQFSIGLSAGPRVPELAQGSGSHSKIPSPSTVPDTANPAGVTAPDLGTLEKPSRPTGLRHNVQELTLKDSMPVCTWQLCVLCQRPGGWDM